MKLNPVALSKYGGFVWLNDSGVAPEETLVIVFIHLHNLLYVDGRFASDGSPSGGYTAISYQSSPSAPSYHAREVSQLRIRNLAPLFP